MIYLYETISYTISIFLSILCIFMGFPGDASGKEPTCQCRKH